MGAIFKTMLLKALFANTAFKNMARSFAVSLLTLITNKVIDKYPALTDKVLEGLDTVEEKLAEYNAGNLVGKSETQKTIEA